MDLKRRKLIGLGLALPAAFAGAAYGAPTYRFRAPKVPMPDGIIVENGIVGNGSAGGSGAGSAQPVGNLPADLLIHSDQPNASSVFVNSTDNPATISKGGLIVKHDEGVPHFNPASILFIKGDLTITSSVIPIDQGDATLDFWFYPAGPNTAQLVRPWRNVSYAPVTVTWEQPGIIRVQLSNGSDTFVNVTKDQWYHLALVRHNGQFGWALNGTFINWEPFDEVLNGSTIYFSDSNFSYALRYDRIDEIRFTRAAQWTDDFTPPSAPYAQ